MPEVIGWVDGKLGKTFWVMKMGSVTQRDLQNYNSVLYSTSVIQVTYS